jgi:hypothetical protein
LKSKRKRTLEELAQGHLISGALSGIIREIKGTTMDCEPYPDEMFDEAERREAANRELAKEEWERKERSDTVLRRYNAFYNDECASLPHGTPITPEHMQAMTLECMIDALICENMNVEYNVIAIDDIKDLIARLYEQGNEYLERVQEFKDSADGVA